MRSRITTIESYLLPIARSFWPELNGLRTDDLESSGRLVDVLGFVYSVSIALIGLGWLIAVTDISLLLSDGRRLPLFIDSFAILAEVLYADGVVFASLLTNRLSKAAIRSRQRARELERLGRLGPDILQSSVDPTTLSTVLSGHVPGMLPTLFQAAHRFRGQAVQFEDITLMTVVRDI